MVLTGGYIADDGDDGGVPYLSEVTYDTMTRCSFSLYTHAETQTRGLIDLSIIK